MKTGSFILTTAVLVTIIAESCSKDKTQDTYSLSYGSPVIYLKNQASDYIVYPTETRAGTYTAFPEGIEVDDKTGAINVSKSETGLRYRISFTGTNGDTASTLVLLSGINFTDKFYHLSLNDSIAFPVYNANPSNSLPVSGSVFDESNTANSGGCSVQTTNGQINLAQCVRNGIFGTIPQNNVRKEFDIDYRLNDPSEKSLNRLRVRLYYYNSMADVAPDLLQTLNDRQSQGVFLQKSSSVNTPITARGAFTGTLAKPRPPCVIIIAQ